MRPALRLLTAFSLFACGGAGEPLAAVPHDIDGDERGDDPDLGADQR